MNIYHLSYKNLRRNKLRNAGAVLRISFGVIILLILFASGIGIETFINNQINVVNSVLNQSTGLVTYISTYLNSNLGMDINNAEIFGIIKSILKNVANFIDLMASIVFLVGIFGVINVMNLNLVERKREIGLLKTMGFTEIQIALSLLLEAGLIGFIGALIGCILVIVGITILSNIFNIGLFHIVMPVWLPFFAIFVTTGLSALIVSYSVWFTIKENSVEILRN